MTGKPANYEVELSQSRISAIGKMTRPGSEAEAKARELDLPLGDAADLSLHEFASALVPRLIGRERPEELEVFEQLIDKSGIKLVRQYCKASRPKRATMDISELPEETRTVLATMDKKAFKALSQARDWSIRRFIDGKAHGITDVPGIGTPAPLPTA